MRHNTALGVATLATERNMARAHYLGARCVAIQAATRPARPATWPATSHDTAGHRPKTQPRHDLPGRSARGLCAQAGPGCAPDSVLTQCTVLSHCLDTVHEHCSMDFSKKKKK